MSYLADHHDKLRAANGGKLTQAVINADYRERGKSVTRQMRRIEAMQSESEAMRAMRVSAYFS